MCKKLNPSQKYLFGEQLGKICKNLKESNQLSPLAQSFGNFRPGQGQGNGFGYNKFAANRGRGNFRGKRGWKGGFSNDRINRFTAAGNGKTKG